MSRGNPLRTWQQQLINSLKHVGSGVVILLLLVAGFWGGHLFAPGHEGTDSQHEMTEIDSGTPTEVSLTTEKIASAGIRLVGVASVDLHRTKTVAATIGYDSTRHLVIKAPVASVVEKLLVKPGQLVTKGEPIAVFSGAEVALARTEIRKCQADARIAKINFDWTWETQGNLTELLTALKAKPTIESVEAKFDGKLLGEHRDHLITTYTKYVLATSVANRTKPLGQQGIIAGKTAEARLSERDVAATAFQSACEQSEFEGRQDLAKAKAELELAHQKLDVAKERLRMVLGPDAEDSATGVSGAFELRAPFDGRIEALHTAPGSRVGQGESAITLADTTQLWVSAQIHQHDWEALQVAVAEAVSVTVPAIPNEAFQACVSFVGPEVSPTTRAISLVAQLDNTAGRFRPGMFAWVALPMEADHHGLTVPTAAIQRHEAKAFVFVQEGAGKFRRVDVSTGIETSDFVEITTGLSAGQQVVDQGAFYLKSELLLEQEEE